MSLLKILFEKDYRQKTNLYNVEGYCTDNYKITHFKNLCDLVIYFRKVWHSKFIRKTFPNRCRKQVSVILSKSRTTSSAIRRKICGIECEATVEIARNESNWNSWVVLHEIAHLCAPYQEQHGPKFMNAFLKLLEEFEGPYLASQFKSLCLINDVDVDTQKTFFEELTYQLGKRVVAYWGSRTSRQTNNSDEEHDE